VKPLWRNGLKAAALLAFCCYEFGDFRRFERVVDLFGSPYIVVPVTLLGAILIATVFAFPLHRAVAYYLLDRRIDAGDYEGATRMADGILRWSPGWSPAFQQKGTALLYSGRLTESEPVLRQAVEHGADDQASGIMAHCALGATLMEQGRYEEARREFEAARKSAGPATPSSDLGLAELELRSQGGSARTAVERAGEGCSRNAAVYRAVDPDTYARSLSMLAWALARDGRQTDAVNKAEEAAALVRGKGRPAAATACFRLGLVSMVSGMKEQARERFEQGAGMDPGGLWGARCAEAARGKLPQWAGTTRWRN
jgi:tetratricopeptide (TPR) repeat protein